LFQIPTKEDIEKAKKDKIAAEKLEKKKKRQKEIKKKKKKRLARKKKEVKYDLYLLTVYYYST